MYPSHTTREECFVCDRIHKLMRRRRILLAPIDADFLVLDRLQAVDGAEGESTIGRVLIRGIIRDDPAAGLLPKGHQSVMHGPVRFHYIEEKTLREHSRRGRMTGRLTIALSQTPEAANIDAVGCLRQLVHSPTSNERDFDKVDNNTLVSCRT